MQISVVNRSSYRDDYVQEVIRAVNRQLAEDLAPYWHVHAQLRLEGPIGDFPDAEHPEALRGDAILLNREIADAEESQKRSPRTCVGRY